MWARGFQGGPWPTTLIRADVNRVGLFAFAQFDRRRPQPVDRHQIIGLLQPTDHHRKGIQLRPFVQRFDHAEPRRSRSLLHQRSMHTRHSRLTIIHKNLLKNRTKIVISLSQITDFLFRNGRPFGRDLRAIDVQRGRDHGLASYNDYREFCGLPRAHKFEDFSDYIDVEVSFNNEESSKRQYMREDICGQFWR